MTGKNYLITGANPSIGRGMFEHYVAQPGNVVVAAVRDVDGAQGLMTVPRGAGTSVHVVRIDSESATDAREAVQELQARGVEHLDVVVSSAGIVQLRTAAELPLEELERVLRVNSLSVLLLYQAALPLLRRAADLDRDRPRFAFISAAAGSLNDMPKYPYPNASYAGSKALANVLVVKMGMENDWLISLCIHPGLVQTDMGNEGARAFGLEKATLTLEESSQNTARIIDNATKEGHSEKFFNQTIDCIHPW